MFIYDNEALNAAKSDLVAVPVGADADQYVAAVDWNQFRDALLDIQTAIRGGTWYGFTQQAADPAPAGVADYLWLRDDGVLFLHTGGGDVDLTAGAGSGDVTAAAAFAVDNVLIKSDGTGKGVQATGIGCDDSNNLTSIGNISLSGTVDGRDIAADGAILDTAVTAAMAFGTDNRLIKSDGTGRGAQATGVTVTDTNDMDVPGNITLTGTVDGRDVATDGTKLDGIESLADVTDATNVAAAGAVMDTDFANTYAGHMWRIGANTYAVRKHNPSAAAAPVVGDDDVDNYGVGSWWFDTTNDEAYVCLDASTGAAVWKQITGAGGGGGTLDDAYDFGGAGAGRAITVAAGAVTMTNSVNDTTRVLELAKTPGSDSAGSILDLTNNAFHTGEMMTVRFQSNSTQTGIAFTRAGGTGHSSQAMTWTESGAGAAPVIEITRHTTATGYSFKSNRSSNTASVRGYGGIELENSTAASAGTPQWSPAMVFTAHGHNGTADREYEFALQNRPEDAATAAALHVLYATAGGAFSSVLNIDEAGNLANSGRITIGADHGGNPYTSPGIVFAGDSQLGMSRDGTGLVITSNAAISFGFASGVLRLQGGSYFGPLVSSLDLGQSGQYWDIAYINKVTLAGSGGIVFEVPNDTGGVGTSYGRIPITVTGVGTKYIEVFNAP